MTEDNKINLSEKDAEWFVETLLSSGYDFYPASVYIPEITEIPIVREWTMNIPSDSPFIRTSSFREVFDSSYSKLTKDEDTQEQQSPVDNTN